MNKSSLVERQLCYTTSEEEAEWELLEARWRSSVYFSVGCYEEALAAYEHALQLDPRDSNARKGEADTLACLGLLRHESPRNGVTHDTGFTTCVDTMLTSS